MRSTLLRALWPTTAHAAVCLAVLFGGCARRSTDSSSRVAQERLNAGLAELRAATRDFVALDAAVAVGYPKVVKECLVHEHHGAMGYHHLNSALMDRTVDIRKPEILLYERLPSGEYRLNGVEYIVPYRAWPSDSVAPRVLGQAFHREENLQFWYLHVWAWTENTNGLFANFHPAVQCPDSARRVYRPSAEPTTPTLESQPLRRASNPILSDGTDYTSDPAPLVANGTLYVLTGRDAAAPGVNDFIMPEWQLLATREEPMRGRWTHVPHFLKPESVFAWASPGRAYAAQIVRGSNGKFYLYAPVVQAASTSKDHFAIGVAVADSPTGPWVDAHPSGPVVSQSYPIANTIQNIDPTVLVDDDDRVFMYWGTFGKVKGVELAPDMVSFRGEPIDVTSLTGFFEAPWIFKRNGTYYLAYAANTAGPTSPCTEAIYYACIAYATAPTALGPWTPRGVILDPVSSTTSHPGIVLYRGTWYLAYHTADARGGGHFRRSVAIDTLTWDDAMSPPRIRKVVPSGGAPFDATPTTNIASHARITASNAPVPVQYWLRALNDGKVRQNPLPPDMWATWSRSNPPRQWVLYQWDEPVTISASSLYVWGDQPAGSGIGVAPPAAWQLEYRDGTAWKAVTANTPYTGRVHQFNRVDFTPVTTRCLRAVFDASTDGVTHAAVAAQEWQVFSTQPAVPRRQSVKGAASASCE